MGYVLLIKPTYDKLYQSITRILPRNMSQGPHIVVLGAGVIGLTISHVLSFDPANTHKITIIACDMPEDAVSQGWASPWAGANWSEMPMGGSDERIKKWETVTL